jgi:hypothetical protein
LSIFAIDLQIVFETVETSHSQKSWVILLMNIHKPNRVMYDISWKKKGGWGSALHIFSIFYTHHRVPNEHMMKINFDTITNNYEVIYVIKTVMKYYF